MTCSWFPPDEEWSLDDDDELERWRARATRVTVTAGQRLEINLEAVRLE
jgi:hypothetical protein